MGVAALDQVVAQYTVVGKAPLQCAFEGIHCVDAFANERATEEQVLVHIRHGQGVGVDPGIAAEQPRVG
ncbi:hypothetical protein D3C80_1054840 [compost metagenome]